MEKESTGIKKHHGLSLKLISAIVAGITFVISASLIVTSYMLSSRYNDVRSSIMSYMGWKNTSLDVQLGSDYLTDQVRSYVVTEESVHLKNYFVEADSNRRENALNVIKENLANTTIYPHIQIAVDESHRLMETEYYAMRLIIAEKGIDIHSDDIPQVVKDVTLSTEDLAMSGTEQKQKAITLVFGSEYNSSKTIIVSNVNEAVSTLDTMMENKVLESTGQLNTIVIINQVLVYLYIIFIFSLILWLYFYIARPVHYALDCLLAGENVEPRGSKEFRIIANTYNELNDQNKKHRERLLYEAEHDKLTGLFNRTGYVAIYQNIDLSKAAYILLDVDNFKEVNDKHGHAFGDKVLVNAAKQLKEHFVHDNSFVFRIGGDEFSVVFENVTDEQYQDLENCYHKVNKSLGRYGVSMSAGVAKGEEGDTTDSLFRKADKALYESKENGRDQISFYKKESK